MLTIYPNPSSGKVNIKINLPEKCGISLSLFNSSGVLVETLMNKEISKGIQVFTWTGENVSPGIYFIELKTNDVTERQKLILFQK
jgi:flagellar hook assembly protein FlgD